MRKVFGLCLFALTLQALACYKHSWYRETPSDGLLNRLYSSPLPNESYNEVSSSNLDKASKLLMRQSFIKISQKEAANLTDTSLDKWGAGELFLVRGLRYPTQNSSYTVYSSNDKILVHFGWLGISGGDVYKAPIVISLQRPPIEVFVLCTGAA